MQNLWRKTIVSASGRRLFGMFTGKDLSWNTAGVNRDGFPWPPDCTTESLDHCMSWKWGSRDVFIVTYPKSGTTWMLQIAHQFASQGFNDYKYFTEVSPFWEAKKGQNVALEDAKEPRVIKTHAPLSLMPSIKDPKARHIYVVRDPRDACVSFYNHSLLTRHLAFDATFNDFFEKFMTGKVYYGSWFDHVHDAVKHKNSPNVLFLTYEDMVKDFDGVLKKVLDFTGYHVSEEKKKEILPRLTFKYMKENDEKFDFTLQYDSRDKSKSFFRKGQVGDHKNYLSDEQKQRLKETYDEVFQGSLPYKL